jgi:hypothetical protein
LKFITRSLIALILLAGISRAATDWDARGKAWWAHLEYLADDKLEGRGTGTEGFAKAAAYVTDQFQKAGLQPAGVHGYAQPVELNVLQLDETQSSLELIRNGKSEPVQFPEDGFLLTTPNAAPVEAPAVFVGYGLKVPQANYDDFAGLDLKGKIAVYVTGGPSSISNSMKAHYQSGEERRKSIAQAGAIGTVMILNPQTQEFPWARTAGARLSERMELKDAAGGAPWPKFAMIMNPAHADKLLAGSGHTFQEIAAVLGTDKPLPRFPLNVTIRAKTAEKILLECCRAAIPI